MKLLTIETLDFSGGGELYMGLLDSTLYQIIREMRGEERAEMTPGGEMERLFESDSVPCEWCMGTGDTLIGRCYLCDGVGSRLSGRGFRIVLQNAASFLTRERLLLAKIEDRLRMVMEFESDEMWQEFVEMYRRQEPDSEFFPEPTLAAQIRAMEGARDATRQVIADQETARTKLMQVERFIRIAEKAVSYDIQEIRTTVEQTQPATQSTCDECGKPAVAWSPEGSALCKRHAYSRGLLRSPDPEPVPESAPDPPVDDSARQGPSRLRMTRPLRLIGGPLDGKTSRVPRGEMRVVIQGHTYERRGHTLVHVEGS